MAQMSYRGVAHDGKKSAPVVSSKDLVYRGARHDGRSQNLPSRELPIAMRYRGVEYTLMPDGTRLFETNLENARDISSVENALA